MTGTGACSGDSAINSTVELAGVGMHPPAIASNAKNDAKTFS
jgi:hypothetical protein